MEFSTTLYIYILMFNYGSTEKIEHNESTLDPRFPNTKFFYSNQN